MPVELLGYGSWRSPITSEFIVAETIGLSQLRVDGDDVFWIEARPPEAGRNVVVRYGRDGKTSDVTPAPFNARTRVHEYGGGAYVVTPKGVYASNFDDQMLYAFAPAGGSPTQITRTAGLRFADGGWEPRASLITVVEDHRSAGREPANYLARIAVDGSGNVVPIVSGADFYAYPRLSPDGKQLAWVSWNHPDMPWDAAELWVGDMANDGKVRQPRQIAGGAGESVFQPEWSPDGVLYFVAEPKGWWNIHRWDGSGVQPVLEKEAEFGRPLWNLGLATFAILDSNRIVCAYVTEGVWNLGLLTASSGRLDSLDVPFSAIFDVRASNERVVLIAGAPARPTAVVRVDLGAVRVEVLKASSDLEPDERFISIPKPMRFPSSDGRTAFGLLYEPKNDDFQPLPEERPPLIVKVHGGPTAAANTSLSWIIQYWTSRGYAVCDVNYAGSTAYGRDYRARLHEQWGVADWQDAVGAASFLVSSGIADGDRLAISGGSAGGFTALCALCFSDRFRAGTSLYGISDLEALLRDTHKFESTYPTWLIGPYPQTADRYRGRSPVHFADQIQSPVIFMQGEDDPVVPPNQTIMMARALLSRNKLFGLVTFAAEQHGFRKASSIRRALDAELDFFATVLTKSGLRY